MDVFLGSPYIYIYIYMTVLNLFILCFTLHYFILTKLNTKELFLAIILRSILTGRECLRIQCKPTTLPEHLDCVVAFTEFQEKYWPRYLCSSLPVTLKDLTENREQEK